MTLLVCANMSSTEKQPILAIGKFKNPRCFHGVTCLPVPYEAKCMDDFSYFLSLDKEMGWAITKKWEKNSPICG